MAMRKNYSDLLNLRKKIAHIRMHMTGRMENMNLSSDPGVSYTYGTMLEVIRKFMLIAV